MAQSAESYFYAYFKLREIVNQNPSIKLVFIEYTNNNLNENMNNTWIWDNEYISNRYPTYSSFMKPADKYILLKNNPIDFVNAISVSFKKKISNILTNDFRFYKNVGGYKYLERFMTDSLYIFPSNIPEPTEMGICKVNINYLSLMIDFCKEKGKKVILIRSPQHERYSGYSNEKIYRAILKEKFADIEYLDFSGFPLSNIEYGDLEHLNYKGAHVFSEWFNRLLNQNFIERTDKQTFINSEIKALKHNRH